MNTQDARRQLMVIAVLDLVVLVLGIVGAVGPVKLFGLAPKAAVEGTTGLLGIGHPAFLSLAIATIALITLFGSLRLGESSALSDEAHIRRAITVSVVAVYLVLVSIVAFYAGWSDTFSKLTETLLGSFTATVSVIVVFYFGASAYLEGRGAEKHDTAPPVQQK